jgi:hypothetical protein
LENNVPLALIVDILGSYSIQRVTLNWRSWPSAVPLTRCSPNFNCLRMCSVPAFEHKATIIFWVCAPRPHISHTPSTTPEGPIAEAYAVIACRRQPPAWARTPLAYRTQSTALSACACHKPTPRGIRNTATCRALSTTANRCFFYVCHKTS